jgi:hypothetical protein
LFVFAANSHFTPSDSSRPFKVCAKSVMRGNKL